MKKRYYFTDRCLSIGADEIRVNKPFVNLYDEGRYVTHILLMNTEIKYHFQNDNTIFFNLYSKK